MLKEEESGFVTNRMSARNLSEHAGECQFVYTCVCACTHACMHACVCVCVCARARVCVHVYQWVVMCDVCAHMQRARKYGNASA